MVQGGYNLRRWPPADIWRGGHNAGQRRRDRGVHCRQVPRFVREVGWRGRIRTFNPLIQRKSTVFVLTRASSCVDRTADPTASRHIRLLIVAPITCTLRDHLIVLGL
jgi:hypothetical protein